MKMKWENRPENDVTGEYGEELVFNTLREKGWNVYTINHEDGSHFIDGIAQILSGNSIVERYIEVKTKPRMLYHNATGYDKKNHKYYNLLNKNHNVYVFFVDYLTNAIWYQSINILNNNQFKFKNQPNHLILFKQDSLIKLRNLNDNEVTKLKELEDNNYN